MDWYYAVGSERKGPVNEAEFQQLVQGGVVTAQTLVWREGMENWQAYGTMSGAGAGGAAAPTGGTEVVCSQCGKIFSQEDVIRYGDVWVCATCKPVFVQRLKEGAAVAGTMDYASFGTRFAAKLLDGIIVGIVNMGLSMAMGMAMKGAGADGQVAVQIGLMVVSIFLNLAYGIFFLGKFGATPGKMACKIKVVMADGEPITYGRAAGRCFAEILSGMICYIGYLMAAFDDEKRTLHDRICNTRVVKR